MTPHHFHIAPRPDESTLKLISAGIGVMRKLGNTIQGITDSFNDYCQDQQLDARTDRSTLSRMQKFDEDDTKLLGRDKRPIFIEFLRLTLAAKGYYWHKNKEAFLNLKTFESDLFDRVSGRYNAVGIDQDGKSLFVSHVHLYQEDEVLESRRAHVKFIFGDEEYEVVINLELWERHFFFTLNHELFPMSAFFRVNLATKPKTIFGVHWAAHENTLQPFGSPFVLQRITDSTNEYPVGRFLKMEDFPNPAIASFLKRTGGTFNIPVQQYYDERDLE